MPVFVLFGEDLPRTAPLGQKHKQLNAALNRTHNSRHCHSPFLFGLSLATLAWYCAVPAVPKVMSLRPLQNRKINSQYFVWVLKSPSSQEGHQKTSWESNPYLKN
jgi:hypothetical protein